MAGEYVIVKQNQYMSRFKKAGATDRSHARKLEDLRVRESGIFRRMVDKGVFVASGNDTYYMDPDAAHEFVVARRKRAFCALVLALIALVILWAFRVISFK